jgi:hypothetical protein
VARTLHFVLTEGIMQHKVPLKQIRRNDCKCEWIVGPFAVTSQNTDNLSWIQGTSQTITWSVNGSNALVGSSSVNIKLSVDGGLTFLTTLASSTPNDGSGVIPNIICKELQDFNRAGS